MYECLRLLDQAMDLARQELTALADADEELLTHLCDKRETLMAAAWEKRDSCPSLPLAEKLTRLQELQTQLADQTRGIVESVRDSLKASRKEGARLSGYHRAVKRPDEPLLISRHS